MYSNLAKSQALPFVFRVPSKPRNPQFSPLGFHLKPLLNPKCVHSTSLQLEFVNKPRKTSTLVQFKSREIGDSVRNERIVNGFRLRNGLRARGFSTSYSNQAREGNFNGKSLPWLDSSKVKEPKRRGNVTVGSLWEESARRSDKGKVETVSTESSENGRELRSPRSFRKGKEGPFSPKKSYYTSRNRESRNGRVGIVRERDYDNGSVVEEEVEREEELEAPDDPRWDKIKNRVGGMANMRGNRFEKPESQRWNRQENWGRKTYREATESTVPLYRR